MLRTWRFNAILALVIASTALFLVAIAPPASAEELEPSIEVEESTELIAEAFAAVPEPERLSLSPGAEYAVEGKPFQTSQKVPSGGAAGLLATAGEPALNPG